MVAFAYVLQEMMAQQERAKADDEERQRVLAEEEKLVRTVAERVGVCVCVHTTR